MDLLLKFVKHAGALKQLHTPVENPLQTLQASIEKYDANLLVARKRAGAVFENPYKFTVDVISARPEGSKQEVSNNGLKICRVEKNSAPLATHSMVLVVSPDRKDRFILDPHLSQDNNDQGIQSYSGGKRLYPFEIYEAVGEFLDDFTLPEDQALMECFDEGKPVQPPMRGTDRGFGWTVRVPKPDELRQ